MHEAPADGSARADALLDTVAGVFVPGGHAPMIDLWNSTDLGRILTRLWARGVPFSAICHGTHRTAHSLSHPPLLM